MCMADGGGDPRKPIFIGIFCESRNRRRYEISTHVRTVPQLAHLPTMAALAHRRASLIAAHLHIISISPVWWRVVSRMKPRRHLAAPANRPLCRSLLERRRV